LQQVDDSDSLETFNGDCSTPKSSWSLGETVCVKVSGPVDASRVRRRVQLVDPDLLIVDSANLTTSPQTFTFTLPSAPTANLSGVSVDNRGTWRVKLVDTTDASTRLITPITVHDPAVAVADLQVNTTIIGNTQATAGTNMSILIWVFDAGPDTAQAVHFSNISPANTTFQSITQTTGPAFTCTTPAVGGAGTTTCSRSSLDMNAAAGFLLTYQVNSNIANSADLTTTTSVASTTLDTRDASNGSETSATADNPTPPACTITANNITAGTNTVNTSGQAGAIVNFADFPAPQTSGTCGSGITYTPPSGSFFAIGSAVVTATTGSGSTTSFVVTVEDDDAPTISCPQPITVSEATAGAGATVNYTGLSASDNSGTVTISCKEGTEDRPSGSHFDAGTHTITCKAIDPANNESSSCAFDVTVNAAPACTITPHANVSANSAADSCGATVTYDPPTADSSCEANTTITCDHASGSLFSIGETLVTCTSNPGGATTSFTVTVSDVTAPAPDIATLPTITQECSASAGIPTTVVIRDRTGHVIGTKVVSEPPTATDNCGGKIAGSTNDQRTYDVPGSYTVRWTYTDAAGNSTYQDQTVVVTADIAPPVPDVATLPTVTGECTATVIEPPTATDNCSGTEVTGTTTDPLTYTSVGSHTIHWKYTDASGNNSFQNQTVVVTDTHAPVVTLNGSSSVTVECHTSYTDAGATDTDNCSATPSLSSTSDVLVNVPGTYHVVWSATDSGGNTGTATRTVTVVDHTIPVITLNGANPMTVFLGSTFTDPGATATDSCAGTFAATTLDTVNTSAVGSYTITYNATDPSGNSAVAVTRTVKVIYNFTGFFSPVGNLPVLNMVNAGRAIPVKFSLAGNQGLNILASGYPVSGVIPCDGSAQTVDITEGTTTAGSSSLSYSPDQYSYVWKTESIWATTCRQLVIKLNDGTEHRANFKFK
jgi:hypothetical protein